MFKLYLYIAVLISVSAMVVAGDTFTKVYSCSNPAESKLRVFGECSTETVEYKKGDELVWKTLFKTSGNDNASVLAEKFICDLKDSENMELINQKINGRQVDIFESAGGRVFSVSIAGADVVILMAYDMKNLIDFMSGKEENIGDSFSSDNCPAFLNRWNWGLYGLGGFNNFHGWMNKVTPKKKQQNPLEDMDFLEKYNYHFEPWLQFATFDNSDGIIQNTGMKWMVKEAERRGIPFSFRVYIDEGTGDWTARRFPEEMEQPAWFLQSGWHAAKQYNKARPHFSWCSREVQRYLGAATMKLMRPYATSSTGGWMMPHGELVQDPWYDAHLDYSSSARKSWHAYLRKHGVSLAEISKMYNMENQPLHSWEQVRIPEFATFSGLPGKVKSLAGEWYYRVENEWGKNPPDTWWNEPEDVRYVGLKNKWYTEKLNTDLWKPITMPGGDDIFSVFHNEKNHYRTTWFRRTFSFNKKISDEDKVYLYFYPISHISIHSGKHKRYHKFFLNGHYVGEIGSWGALDVSKYIEQGNNEIAFQLQGSVWNGRIFLSTSEPQVYPYLGYEQNKLWLLWQNWRVDTKYDAWCDILDGMRQVDPVKPIKFMAPIGFGGTKWRKLAWNYGGWPHFTGEGIWFFPWYKRYAALYGIPATSELAGPCNNVNDQFNGYRRVFLAGLDGHEPVFLAQTYTRNPELRKWWIEHDKIIKRLGKYDIDGPQVLLYRCSARLLGSGWRPYPSLGKFSRIIQNPWEWDLGRGTLQTLGYSFLYLDDDGIADGKMYGYKIIIDSGNEILDKTSISKIKDWVEAGGTFVALPFTGRDSLLKPDTWPIKELTGCDVVKDRQVGDGTVIIEKDQKLLKALAGREFADDGKSIDYVGNDLNNLSFELKPGADSQIIAKYENGKPAIVLRKLGKGQVIVLGSAFWRNSRDVMGIWWAEKGETEFITDLLNGLKFDKPLCNTDDRLVWAQPYRSNNGLERVVTFISWHDDKDVTVTARMRLPEKPEVLTSYGVDGVQSIPFEWNNGIAEFKLNMPAKEVKLIYAEVFSPADAIDHWWQKMKKLWHPLVASTIDFSKYTVGKWEEPTLDLSDDARFTNIQPEDNWLSSEFDDSKWKKSPLDILNFWGAKTNAEAWVRKSFVVPDKWIRQGGEIHLISASVNGIQYKTPTKMILNGTVLHDYIENRYNEYDVTKILQDEDNILAFHIKSGQEFIGFSGNVYLYHKMPAVESINLDGEWNEDNSIDKGVISLPGKGKIKHPSRTIFIPAEWQGKYNVHFYMKGTRSSILGAWVNGRLVRRFHNGFGNICDIDITNYIKFGAKNKFVLARQDEYRGKNIDPDAVPEWDIEEIKLELYKQ